MPVRVGVPQGVGGLVEDIRGPSFATPVGLAKWELLRARSEREKTKRRELPETLKNRFSKVADWFGQML